MKPFKWTLCLVAAYQLTFKLLKLGDGLAL